MNVSQFLTDSRVVNALSAINASQQEFYVKEFARRFEEDTMHVVVAKYSDMASSRQCLELIVIALDLAAACRDFGLHHQAPRPKKVSLTDAKRAQTLATIQALMATL